MCSGSNTSQDSSRSCFVQVHKDVQELDPSTFIFKQQNKKKQKTKGWFLVSIVVTFQQIESRKCTFQRLVIRKETCRCTIISRTRM